MDIPVPIWARAEHIWESVALLWQPGNTQCVTKACRKRWSTIYAGKLAAITERWMQFEHPRGSCPRFFQSAELGKGSGQLHISDAVCRIGLDGPIGSATGFVVTATQQMAHRLRVERGESPWVERTEPHSLFAPLDGSLCFSAPSEDDAAQNVGQGG